MDRRLLLAIGLMLIVAVLPSILFPPEPTTTPTGAEAVSDSAVGPADTVAREPRVEQVTPSMPAPEPVAQVEDTVPQAVSQDSVVVESGIYRYVFSTVGARLLSVSIKSYPSFAPGDSGPAQLVTEDSWFFQYSLVFGADTVSLADWRFLPSRTEVAVEGGDETIEWVAQRGPAVVRIVQTFRPDQFLFDVQGRFTGIPAEGGLVIVNMGPRIRLVEADSVWDFRNYAVVTKARSIERTTFGSLDPGEREQIGGPLDWVAYKSRYFVFAILTVDEAFPRIGAAIVTGGRRIDKYAKEADLQISLPAPGGQFSYSVYLGPQEVGLLSQVGHELEDLNPYGWFLKPIIQPIATIVARILVWMHVTLNLEYGWVLILFGVAVRIIMWPLNQKAMHSSMAMQAIQPEIKAAQERYKGDPQRLQQETMKLYREHGVNPLGGCLPMLLPMPVLFALFFVFRETIEFRGVPFLWLPDLSRADPLYIIPVLMGLSMFVVSKLGQRGIPPNPQSKMMVYFMPVMLTVLFFKFAAGLNLYYAVSNIASIPQQWLISEKRLKRVGKKPA
jgi:YidC/Oxa1 family membrane protein insertase